MYSPPLTPPQEQVLALISAGSTISDAAQSAGVHRNTVHNWIDFQPHFRLALIRARDSKALFWREEAERLAAAAVHTINALMTEHRTPAIVRLKAAQSVLALAMAPPSKQESPAAVDLIPSLIAAPPPAIALEAGESPDDSAESRPAAPPLPEIVHNSAQSVPANPPAVPRSRSKTGRNEACPCGSGKKFKHCCLENRGIGAPFRPDAAA